jgi:hypothetical protein
MTPYANPTTTLQVCPRGCPGVWYNVYRCPRCGGALETVTVELVPTASKPHIKRVLINPEIGTPKHLTIQTV